MDHTLGNTEQIKNADAYHAINIDRTDVMRTHLKTPLLHINILLGGHKSDANIIFTRF